MEDMSDFNPVVFYHPMGLFFIIGEFKKEP